MIPFNPSLPNLSKSQPVRAFAVGQYLALLLERPKSLAETGGLDDGLITYLYALAIITTTKPTDLVYMVTSELSGDELRRIIKEKTGKNQTADPFLCVFNENGEHHTLESSPDWADQEIFVARALEVVREHFKVAAAPVELQPGGGS